VNLFNSAGVLQASVTFGASPAGPSFPTFDNAAGLNNTAISQLSVAGVHNAIHAVNDANEIGSPGTVGSLAITEVAPWSSSNSPLGADWFEVTNTSSHAVDITGWKMDDNSNSSGLAVALNGITSIAAGESVIFIESDSPGNAVPAFKGLWFGANPPANLQVGTYSGSGVGLSTTNDAVNLFNSAGVLQASVTFGASPAGPSFKTFDNAAGLSNVAVSQLSADGVNGAFVALGDVHEIGSPGRIVNIQKTTATVTLSNLTQAYTGAPLTPTAVTAPPNLAIVWTNAPQTSPGRYTVTATINDPTYQGTASGTFNIFPTDKNQCMNNGWKNVFRADGTSFKNQGDCIQFVNTGK
jgi:hypothetical protein